MVAPAQAIDDSPRITVEDGVFVRIEPAEASRTRHRSGVRRPTRPPAHARARGRGDGSLRHRGRRRRWLLRDPRDAEHGSRRRFDVGARCARRAGREEAVVPTGFMAAISKGQRRRGADGDGGARRCGSGGVHGRRPARRLRGSHAPRTPVQRAHASCGSRSTARSPHSRGAATCMKVSCPPSSASGRIPRRQRA